MKVDDSGRWPPGPQQPTLTDGKVHLWLGALQQPASAIDHLRLTLSPDEQERAARFQFPRNQDEFIVGRGLLRSLLGRYLALEPARVTFSYSQYGKPLLELSDGRIIHFNLSHSGEFVLFAFSGDRPVGVDIELLREMPDALDIAGFYFSKHEQSLLATVPQAELPLAFFNCWTRKEAFIKALGEGLSLPLDRFDVSFLPGQPARLLRALDSETALDQWRLESIDVGAQYVAAVCAAGQAWSTVYFSV